MKGLTANLKASRKALRAKLKSVLPDKKNESQTEDNQFEKPLIFAYRLVGGCTDKLMPLFKDLDNNIETSGLKVNFKAYVNLAILTSTLTALTVLITLPLLFFFAFQTPLLSALLYGLGGALMTGAVSTAGFYAYPIYRADKRKRELDDELPFTMGYLSILATAGISPERMFYSISTLDVPLTASFEAKEIVKDINLFGLDVISALEKAANRTPSIKLQNVIKGILSTAHTGGNLGVFLRARFKTAMKLKRLSLKKYSDNLSVLSELYVALLLTGPLLLAIMVSVMSVMGGSLGVISPDLMLSLLTYIVIPFCAIIFLIILDSISPKW